MRRLRCGWKIIPVLALLAFALSFGFGRPPSRVLAADAGNVSWKAAAAFTAEPTSERESLQKLDFHTILYERLPAFDIDPDSIPDDIRQKLKRYLHMYAVVHRSRIQGMLRRGVPYLQVIKRLLRQYDLPTYFAYIPLAESAFHTNAVHPESGALGLWQLMPSTARAYGLQVSDLVDERLDPFLSSRAAARYLQELQNIFGRKAPLHILAAYNYGESNLSKAIVRARTRDIWSLLRKRQIPSETREYLVKMVAFWMVCADTDRFGLNPQLPEIGKVKSYVEITYPHQVSVEFIANQVALSEQDMRRMNPHLLKDAIPAYTPIRVPVSSVDTFERFEVRLTSPISTERCCARLIVTDTCLHTVAEGETVSAIARRYALSPKTLKSVNGLEGPNPIIRPGQRLAVCEEPEARTEISSKLW